MTEAPIEVCPECHGRTKRLISGGAGILFKGPGFYETDYRSSSYQKEAQKEKSDSTADSASKRDKPKKTESPKQD
jgi:predicted nucleic acid-binding Zn ribbon protein